MIEESLGYNVKTFYDDIIFINGFLFFMVFLFSFAINKVVYSA